MYVCYSTYIHRYIVTSDDLQYNHTYVWEQSVPPAQCDHVGPHLLGLAGQVAVLSR